jgi:hypothetical protein
MTEKKAPEQVVDKPADKKVTKAQVEKTPAEKIWDEIKDLTIEMFALPNQKVHQYCSPVTIDPSKLFLLTSAGSVLTALEAVVKPKYVVERQERFVVVTPASSK